MMINRRELLRNGATAAVAGGTISSLSGNATAIEGVEDSSVKVSIGEYNGVETEYYISAPFGWFGRHSDTEPDDELLTAENSTVAVRGTVENDQDNFVLQSGLIRSLWIDDRVDQDEGGAAVTISVTPLSGGPYTGDTYFVFDAEGNGWSRYELSVSGSLEKHDEIEDHDSLDMGTASGWVYGSRDAYVGSGRPNSITFRPRGDKMYFRTCPGCP